MGKNIKNIIWMILNRIRISALIQLLFKNSYLKENGWFKSYYLKESVDNEGNPIPWFTYPFIRFIQPRLQQSLDIFEFGCGNSTLWFAPKVRSIKSVDHDKEWIIKISSKLPNNVRIIHKQLIYGGDYCREVNVECKKYHIIIIDGRDRNNCVKESLQSLTMGGVIIFDNTQLDDYAESMTMLKNAGFNRLDFYGIPPIVHFENCTTIFYRANNCLGI